MSWVRMLLKSFFLFLSIVVWAVGTVGRPVGAVQAAVCKPSGLSKRAAGRLWAMESSMACPWASVAAVVSMALAQALSVVWAFWAASARMLGPVNSRSVEWWTMRSMAQAVVIGSLKIRSHSENTRLLVISTLLRS